MGFFKRLKGSSTSEVASTQQLDQTVKMAVRNPGNRATESQLMERTMVLQGGSQARPQSSIYTEAAPSELHEFNETRGNGDTTAIHGPSTVMADALPIIGRRSDAQQQKILSSLVVAGLVGLLLAALYSGISYARGSKQVSLTGQALMESQRLAKSVSQAVVGDVKAFIEVKDSIDNLSRNVRGLNTGEGDIPVAPLTVQGDIEAILPLLGKAESNAKIVLTQQPVLTQVGKSLASINRESSDLLELAEAIAAIKLQQGASNAEISAMGQVVMLTQRIGKSANEFLTSNGISPEAVFLLGRDLNTFKELVEGVLDGNPEYKLPGTKDAATREKLQVLLKKYDQTRANANNILTNLQGMAAALGAQSAIVADSDAMRKGLQSVQESMSSSTGFGVLNVLFLMAALGLLSLGGWGFLKIFVRDQKLRAEIAEQQKMEAERQEQEAKRVNDANQAAILRLMNELQTVAEGDLTQHATVTEDITGAIADSVNYTVEELRYLVSQVQGTVGRVTDTTQRVESTSTELLAASTEQLREIRETGESVLTMASRINSVSTQAQESAQVARQSLETAERGLRAVQDTIGGMNAIRDQIQETAKRIKRLGESSQEIGEITELISDITEQTNLLSINANIQATSAGEAGRGFSVVASEVQRLAERSADATRQIAALVKAIQTDTQDAVAAMERSTQGVVEGARLSDAAGSALGDIDRVSRKLAELIEQISVKSNQEAQSANVVASNIQHIFAVTEQTGEGTRSTAQMVHELAAMAEELKQSVSRFKIN